MPTDRADTVDTDRPLYAFDPASDFGKRCAAVVMHRLVLRDILSRLDSDPTAFGDLLAVLGWRGGTIHDTRREATRRLADVVYCGNVYRP